MENRQKQMMFFSIQILYDQIWEKKEEEAQIKVKDLK